MFRNVVGVIVAVVAVNIAGIQSVLGRVSVVVDVLTEEESSSGSGFKFALLASSFIFVVLHDSRLITHFNPFILCLYRFFNKESLHQG